jgi:hypothetical protein
MHKPHKSLCKGGEQPLSKAVFFNIAGISPELEEFVSDFFQRLEFLNSLSMERRYEIEVQMDAVQSLFA